MMQRLFTVPVVAALAASVMCSPVSPYLPTNNVTIINSTVPIVPPGPLPAPNPASNCDEIVELFRTLGRNTIWKVVQKLALEGPLGEPEGVVVMGNGKDVRYFVSSGMYTEPTVSFNDSKIINGTDRFNGEGVGHMIVFDGYGSRLADLALTPVGDPEYHTGGFDYGGGYIYATLAQYRPNSTMHMMRVEPRTLKAETLFRANEHYGGSVFDTTNNQLVTANWGSRNFSLFDLKSQSLHPEKVATPLRVTQNPSFYADYQDCKFLGHPKAYDGRAVMVCSGVASIGNATIGGVSLLDMDTLVPLYEIPIAMFTDKGTAVTQNPMDLNVVDHRLRFYFIPDQNNSTLWVLEAQSDSPYEF